MKLERLLAIIMLLINRGRVTAGELAEYFEVSVRTIYRDLETINQAGIPIISYQGVNGGYGIMETYKVDKQVLTPDEMVSIVTALKGVNTTLNDRKFRDIEEKMKSLLPTSVWRTRDRFDEQIVIDFSGWGSNTQVKKKVVLIREALEESRVLEFQYINAQGVVKHRTVEPMTLVLKGYAWYLEGYCRVRNDFRLFRLSRVRDLEMKQEAFVRREHSFAGFLWDVDGVEVKLVSMVLHFSTRVRVRAEDYFEEEQREVQEDGSLIVRVTYPEDEWVYGMILSFGSDVKVLEPSHLREIIRERCKQMLVLYEDEM